MYSLYYLRHVGEDHKAMSLIDEKNLQDFLVTLLTLLPSNEVCASTLSLNGLSIIFVPSSHQLTGYHKQAREIMT